jgi:hypothetical protein
LANNQQPHGFDSQHAVTEKEDEMSDLERNKKVVVEYYELAFNDHKPQEAVERYVGSQYIQHNPQAPDGADACGLPQKGLHV